MSGKVASLPPKPAGPLSSTVFRALWIATIVSNIGTWMNDVAAGWLMTSLSSDPLVVALVQAATTVPMFLLALPAGAIADLVNRRKLLLGAQTLTVTGASLLALATLTGAVTPWLLLTLTAMMAVGYALAAPAFQAIVPELVDREALQQAVTLNGLGINIARSIGPALAGVVIASSGPGAVFAVNAASTCGVIAVLYRWKREAPDRALPAEHFIGAMRAGLRYALRSPELRSVILRAFTFFLFSSSLWALLPLIAREELGLGPTGYGGLLSFMGVGAILGALAMPSLRSRMSGNTISICASLLMAGALVALSRTNGFVLAAMVLLVVGLAWIAMMSILNGSAQAGSPDWVKARALSVYLLVDGRGIAPVGLDRQPVRHFDGACGFRLRPACHHCIGRAPLPAGSGSHARSRALASLARPAGGRRPGHRQRSGSGHSRISDRSRPHGGIHGRHARHETHSPPRRGHAMGPLRRCFSQRRRA